MAITNTDSSLKKELIPWGNNRVSKITSIYGANGSGKSNFLRSLSLMQTIVTKSITYQPGDLIPYHPHQLSMNEPTELKIQFVKDGKRFAYGFSYIAQDIQEEYFYSFPNGRKTKIFERKSDAIEWKQEYKKDVSNCMQVIKPNRLCLSCAANFTNIKEVEDAFRFFKDDLVFYSDGRGQIPWLEYSVRKLGNEPQLKANFLKFMNELDTGIEDIDAKIEKKFLSQNDINGSFPDSLKAFLSNREFKHIDARVLYKQFDVSLEEESDGIQKMFALFCPIYDIIENGKIFLWDEIETHLHPSIVQKVIRMFKESSIEIPSQLIFTTHDTELLDLSLFRRDQIWFTELRKKDRSTDLYSLSDLKHVRKDENIKKGYLTGRYGAIPMLNSSIQNGMEENMDE